MRLIAIALLMLLGLVACSTDIRPPATRPNKSLLTTHPEQVVVLFPLLLEDTLALGITPVGAPKTFSSYLQLSPSQWQKIKDVGGWGPPNLEKILTLKPDLILDLKSPASQEAYPLLSHIAPTVFIEITSILNWKQVFYQVANALGRKEAADRVMADYQVRLDRFKTHMGTQISSLRVSVLSITKETILLFNKKSFPGMILEDAGLSRPPSQTLDDRLHFRRESWERLSDIDADVLFVVPSGFKQEADTQKALQQLSSQPLWSKLKVVQQGKVYEVGTYWLANGPMSALRVLDDLEKYILNPKRG
ncbi:iron-siderophore ABC transporter substrate-binding protein [Scytonema sp. NUACC26]